MLEYRLKNLIVRRAVCLFGLLLGVQAIVQAEQLPIKTYTTADGLGSSYIIRIVRDSMVSFGSAPGTG